jgi:hypothetical protein
MGFRGAVKSGGGFLNGVDGKIVGYSFTAKGPGSDSNGEWVFFVPQIHTDGAEKAITQHLFFGGADRYTISKDGQTVENADGGNVTIGANTPTALFLTSMLDNGLDEAELPDLEGGEPLNLAGIVGYRARFAQQVDEKATSKLGKRKYKDAQGNEREANRTNTVVSAVYGKEGGASGKAATKPTLAKGSKATATVVRDKADAAMLKLIAAKGGTLRVAQISSGIIQQLIGDTDKDAVRALAKSDEYLNDATERDVLVYDEAAATVQAA